MLYSCTNIAPVGVEGFIIISYAVGVRRSVKAFTGVAVLMYDMLVNAATASDR